MEGQHQLLRTEAEEGKRDVQEAKQQAQLSSASPPPSVTSSPSHEFSFTISLHPPAAKTPAGNKTKSSPTPPFAAIDLSPADEIFFHGHLLPLHLLSHLPVSPRSSTNSLDSFTLPIKELLQNDDVDAFSAAATTNDHNHNNKIDDAGDNDRRRLQESRRVWEGKGGGKSKSFSLFGIPKWRKNCHDQEKYDEHQNQKRKSSKFDRFKRYMRFVKPFLSLRNKRGSSDEFLKQQPYSYSGNLRLRSNKKELRGWRGEFSAPASMITSPTNSGLLVASGTVTPTKSDSTMEELQAAIQAAIAHCKKSIATDDKSTFHN